MAAAATGVRATAVEPFAPDLAVETARDLYERHGSAIFRFCRSRLRSREEAEDAGQTTFLYAFRALNKGVVPVSELSWLLKIAENVCKTRRHDARRRFALEVAEDPERLGRMAAPAGAEPEVLMPLEAALGRLTDSQREALLLREWQGLSYREIAARLGIAQNAAEVLIFRARRALAEELEAPGTRRRRARALDFGWLAGLAKQFLGGGALAGKTALAALAVAVTATVSTVAVAVRADAPAQPVRTVDAPPSQAPAAARDPRRPAPAPAASEKRSAPAARALAVQPREAPAAPVTERVQPGETPSAGPPSAQEPRPAPDPARDGDAQAPGAAPVEKITGDVTSAVAPIVAEVESTVEPVVGAVQGVADDVVETAQSTVPTLPQDPVVPSLPQQPELPQLP